MKVSIFWFRRDLRLQDNTALHAAVSANKNVLPIFIFDENILKTLADNDPRINFIYNSLLNIHKCLQEKNSSVLILKGKPEEVWIELIKKFDIENVFANKDYEPYSILRDQKIAQLLLNNGIELILLKDQVIHEESEVMKKDGTPYTVFTPYKNKWLEIYTQKVALPELKINNFHRENYTFPILKDLGFRSSDITVKPYSLKKINQYAETRNFPNLDATTYLSPHLRFGTISIRQIIAQLKTSDAIFLSELIWREFFMQILYHFPKVVEHNFKKKYNGIVWRNDENEFEKWCQGKTGYPLVDAGMRQLNATGYMHNRIRMITAGFLCKHLLIDWRWGEAYFANNLLDYELSSNNGNWQWAAGTGCDAAPYFRIFNPVEQLRKFDSSELYIKKWLPEYGTSNYPSPIVEHKFARTRALEKYKSGIGN